MQVSGLRHLQEVQEQMHELGKARLSDIIARCTEHPLVGRFLPWFILGLVEQNRIDQEDPLFEGDLLLQDVASLFPGASLNGNDTLGPAQAHRRDRTRDIDAAASDRVLVADERCVSPSRRTWLIFSTVE
jgi:hypothetical protein